jgi:hypothetical protein
MRNFMALIVLSAVAWMAPAALARPGVGVNVLTSNYTYIRNDAKLLPIGQMVSTKFAKHRAKFYWASKSYRKGIFVWGYVNDPGMFKGCGWVPIANLKHYRYASLSKARQRAKDANAASTAEHKCHHERVISYSRFARSGTPGAGHCAKPSVEDVCRHFDNSLKKKRKCCRDHEVPKKNACPFRVKASVASSCIPVYRNFTGFPNTVNSVHGSITATGNEFDSVCKESAGQIAFSLRYTTKGSNPYALVFLQDPETSAKWGFVHRDSIEPDPTIPSHGCGPHTYAGHLRNFAIDDDDPPPALLPTGETCTPGGSCPDSDVCGDDGTCFDCTDNVCADPNDQTCTGNEPSDDPICGSCADDECDAPPGSCERTTPLLGPIPGSGTIDCNGQSSSGSLAPHGTVSVLSAPDDLTELQITVDVTAAHPDSSYAIQIWEAGPCDVRELADTGETLETDHHGDGTNTLFLPVPWSPFGNGGLGDGQGGEGMVVVLDGTQTDAPSGDLFSTNGALQLNDLCPPSTTTTVTTTSTSTTIPIECTGAAVVGCCVAPQAGPPFVTTGTCAVEFAAVGDPFIIDVATICEAILQGTFVPGSCPVCGSLSACCDGILGPNGSCARTMGFGDGLTPEDVAHDCGLSGGQSSYMGPCH